MFSLFFKTVSLLSSVFRDVLLSFPPLYIFSPFNTSFSQIFSFIFLSYPFFLFIDMLNNIFPLFKG